MPKEETKKVTITILPSQVEKAKKESIKVFGKVNLSGYIQMLIQKGI